MAEVKGIKETKDVMEFIFSFVDAIGKAKADDKFTWTDARYFIDPVKKLFEAVDNIEDVIPENIDDLVKNLNEYRKTIKGDFEEKVETLNEFTKGLVNKKKD